MAGESAQAGEASGGAPAEGAAAEAQTALPDGAAEGAEREEAPGLTAEPQTGEAGDGDGGEGDATAAGAEGGDGGEGAEGGEGKEGAEGEEGEGVELKDDSRIEIDGEEITFGNLRQAYADRQKAQELVTQANAAITRANTVTRAWLDDFAETGFQAFTRAEKGDTQRGYSRFLQECARVVNDHLEWEQMTPEAKSAVVEKRRAESLERELESYRARDRQSAEAKQELEDTNQAWGEITKALKAAGHLPEDKRQLGRYVAKVSDIWLMEKEAGREISIPQAVALFKEELAAFRKSEREALKKENIARAKANRSGQVNAKTGAPNARPSEDRQPIIYDPADFGKALQEAR